MHESCSQPPCTHEQSALLMQATLDNTLEHSTVLTWVQPTTAGACLRTDCGVRLLLTVPKPSARALSNPAEKHPASGRSQTPGQNDRQAHRLTTAANGHAPPSLPACAGQQGLTRTPTPLTSYHQAGSSSPAQTGSSPGASRQLPAAGRRPQQASGARGRAAAHAACQPRARSAAAAVSGPPA